MPPDFASLGLAQTLVSVVAELGYERLTPIQASSIPVLMQGKDFIGQSDTGSGKTAAFALPLLHHLPLHERRLRAVVLCPTRELSAQVTRELRTLGRKRAGLQVLSVCGGESYRDQANGLERGVHVVVGTPGRVVDHLERGTLALAEVTTVVLDEADRMLEMGFQKDIERILGAMPEQRQTALFSATFPPEIETLSGKYLRGAVHRTVEQADSAPEIRQRALLVEPEDRLRGLCWALAEHRPESALVFCNFKASADAVQRALRDAGVSVDCLHGDLEQFHRDQVMARFRNDSVRVLVATDVAARGIDVKALDLVLNYELPPQPEVYLHRIGRTGRAGERGVSVSLVTPKEKARLRSIEAFTGASIERIARGATGDTDAATLARSSAQPARMATILISGGRKDKLRPGDILGALTGDAGGLSAEQVGKIEVHDRLSYVAVSRAVARRAASSLNRGRIKKKRFRATYVN